MLNPLKNFGDMKRAILFAVCAVTLNVTAQTESLARPELKVHRHSVSILDYLNVYIDFMADPNNDSNTRFYYKEEAQKLFINDCGSFYEIVEFADGAKDTIRREGVKMFVVSQRSQTPRTELMKEYFRGLTKSKYKYVKMDSADLVDMRVSKLKPYGKDVNGNMLYVCSVFFDSVLAGVTPEKQKIREIIHKWVVCYVQVDEVCDSQTGEIYPEYMIRLGDVYVESIEKL